MRHNLSLLALALVVFTAILDGASSVSAGDLTVDSLDALAQKGRFEEAIRLGDRLLAEDEAAPVRSLLGAAYALTGNFAQAQRMIDLAIAAEEPNAAYYSPLSEAVFQRSIRNPSDAVRIVDDLIAAYPSKPLAFLVKASALYDLGEFGPSAAMADAAIALESELASAHAAKGVALMAKGDLTEAKSALGVARDLDPSDAQTLNALARIHSIQGDTGGAIDLLKQILLLQPQAFEIHNEAAKLYLAKGDSQGSIDQVNRAIAAGAGPEVKLDLSFTLARAYAMRGELGVAVDCLEQILKQRSQALGARYLLGLYQMARGDYPAARLQFETLKALERGAARASVPLALLACREGKIEQARDFLLAALQTVSDAQRPAVSFYLGGIALCDGDWPAAAERFAAARSFVAVLDTSPSTVESLYSGTSADSVNRLLLGMYLVSEGLLEQGQSILVSAESNPLASLALGNLAARRGDTSTALETLHLLTAEYPDFATAHFALGDVLIGAGRHAEGLSALEAASAIAPENLTILSRLVGVYASQEQVERLEAALRRMIAIRPDLPLPHNELALLLVEQAATVEAALEHAKRAVELGNRHPAFLDTLGWVHLKAGNPQTAATLFREALGAQALDRELEKVIRDRLERAEQGSL